jgi:cytochrome b561
MAHGASVRDFSRAKEIKEAAMNTRWKSTPAGYGSVSIAFHWLMLLLLAAVYAAMELKGIYPKGSPGRASMAFWHYSLGLSVFCLVWLRLAVRLAGNTPEVVPPMPGWQAIAAKAIQLALYALMIGLPLLGWLTLSAQGKTIPFFGAELPALIGTSEPAAKWLKDIHETAATTGYFIAGLHASAALFHHYVKRDNALRLMLPGG